MKYERFSLKTELAIHKLISYHYYELEKNYYSIGEKHNFWEFVYVDKGQIQILTDSQSVLLEQGDFIFYSPNEFHAGGAYGLNPPNLFIISFECNSPMMNYFHSKKFRLNETERALLTILLQEGKKAFYPPIDSRGSKLNRADDAPFGSEQIIKNYLEILLITLYRRQDESITLNTPESRSKVNKEQMLVKQIIHFMESHLSSHLTLDEISHACSISKSQLKTVFKAQVGISVMEYFNQLKVNEAKYYIRKEQYNFTQISDLLGYSSIHYFSRVFKKMTGMTMSEYARSVRADVQHHSP